MEEIEKPEPSPEKLENFLADLKKQRDDCIDDLPAETVTFADKNYYRYKCRGNWWHYVTLRFEMLLSRPDIIDDPEVEAEMKDFLNYTQELNFQNFRTRADIDRANTALDVLIEHLEKKARG